nr:hypothetical protein Iba_chr01aCG16410 [Ipomoea batatas]
MPNSSSLSTSHMGFPVTISTNMHSTAQISFAAVYDLPAKHSGAAYCIPEVAELEPLSAVELSREDKNVLGLQVTVDDSQGVHVMDAFKKLISIKSSQILQYPAGIPDQLMESSVEINNNKNLKYCQNVSDAVAAFLHFVEWFVSLVFELQLSEFTFDPSESCFPYPNVSLTYK